MKKSLLLIATVALLFTGACKKTETTTITTGSSSWMLGTTTYKVVFSYRNITSGGNSNTLLSFYDGIPSGTNSTVSSVNFAFKTAPTVSGTYHVVPGVGATLTDNQTQLSAGSSSAAYAYLGTTAVDVTVTVTGGKITVVLPEITVKSTVSGQPDVKLSASVTEI